MRESTVRFVDSVSVVRVSGVGCAIGGAFR
jgi:hypothetical protein